MVSIIKKTAPIRGIATQRMQAQINKPNSDPIMPTDDVFFIIVLKTNSK